MKTISVALLSLFAGSWSLIASEQSEPTTISETKDGIRFGLWSKDPVFPAPTMIVFDPGTVDRLSDPYYQRRYRILVEEGYTDPKKVVVGGSSSGGFLALHYVAHDSRIRGGAVVVPVTDLAALLEFAGMQMHPAVRALALNKQAEKLADRSIWVLMGDRDARVGTGAAIQLAQAVWKVAAERDLRTGVELHVLPEPGGHAHPAGSHQQAAEWILKLNQ